MNGRAGGIRTHDLLHPKQARYQAALQPELYERLAWGSQPYYCNSLTLKNARFRPRKTSTETKMDYPKAVHFLQVQKNTERYLLETIPVTAKRASARFAASRARVISNSPELIKRCRARSKAFLARSRSI